MANEVDIANLIRERQDKFVETRTIIETEVNKFLDSIARMDEDIREKCGYIEGATARNLLPALWVDPFDEAVYNKQLQGVVAYISKVKAVCDEIDREARECLMS